jgi:hypothetical protein
MVFIRYNATEANPNPHINFITALKDRGPEDEALAVKILRALAAQVRPVMKKYGFVIIFCALYTSHFTQLVWKSTASKR